MAAVRLHSQHNHKSTNPFTDSSYPKPPPPPPKSSKYLMPTAVPKSQPNDLSDAVRDTVVLRGHSDYPRTRPTRSQTAVSPPTNTNSHANTRRSHSQDSAGIAEKSKNKRTDKKGSRHADVIDRLDITGVGQMFHHDGPFDACAPSRNRQRNMAPIHSWSPAANDQFAVTRYGDSAYPGAHAYSAFTNDYPEPPKKKVDAIAEAWGMHEPEPFEEFLAGGGKVETPASSIYNGLDSHARTNKRTKDSRDDTHNTNASPSRPRVTTRRTVPPPQPIFVPDPVDMGGEGSPPLELPKRSKSLMQRIRRRRDVPVVSDTEPPSMPNSPTDGVTRPSHRAQNSFLGRFGGASKSQSSAHGTSSEKPEPYVLIDPYNKQLPPPPGQNSDSGPDSPTYASGGGAVLGRKTSLIQKVGRAVRGHK